MRRSFSLSLLPFFFFFFFFFSPILLSSSSSSLVRPQTLPQ